MGKPPVYDRAALNQSADEKLSIKAERGSGHWRFLLDHERVTWTDGILGKISIDAALSLTQFSFGVMASFYIL